MATGDVVKKGRRGPRKPAVDVRSVQDRGIKSLRRLPEWRKYAFHTVHIPENEQDPPYVDVCMSGTTPVKKIIEVEKIVKGEHIVVKEEVTEQVPVGPFRLWIKRGMDVANVPTWAVHILVETAIEVRYRQKQVVTRTGDKKNAFIPYTRKSYPCSIIESYNERRDVVDESMMTDQDPYAEETDGGMEDMTEE